MQTIAERYRFFKEHAGYIVGRAAECALALARAEAFAEVHALEFKWEDDCEGDAPAEDCEMLWCACVDSDGEHLASLGGIELRSPSFIQGIPRDPYVRVIQAELASEAQAEFERRFQAEADQLSARPTYAQAGA